ncbi:MAG: GNAT family N-acetyltransferase, partial [Rhodoglobus sp.]
MSLAFDHETLGQRVLFGTGLAAKNLDSEVKRRASRRIMVIAAEAEAELVGDGLDSANAGAAPLDDVVPLSCFARLPDGAVVGGAIGRTWGVCCELQQLWVEPARRRQGLGAELVKAFEAHAAARGCSTYYLETFSFQAPSLYRSLGYEVALALEGFA